MPHTEASPAAKHCRPQELIEFDNNWFFVLRLDTELFEKSVIISDNPQTLKACVRFFWVLSMLSHTFSSRMSYLRPGIPESPRIAACQRIIDSQVDLCPTVCIELPALLFTTERVKPYQQGYSSAMDKTWRVGGAMG